MSEEKNGQGRSQEELMRRLKAIGADLWGNLASPGAGTAGQEEANYGPSDLPEKERKSEGNSTGKAENGAGKKTNLENLWVTADETVDWTEALLWESPRDGLTGQKLWSFYHRMAPRVLEGDTEAYAEVLTTINPLGDLTDYVSGMILRTPGADRLECAFECQPEELEKHGQRYLGALSLRIARDLLAVLPVNEVKISGNLNGKEKVNVVFRREQVRKRKMAFLIPEDFLQECDGTMNL